MHKQLKGYMTVEASFVMPLVLLLYLLIIVSGFYLYDRCVLSQDTYLIAFRTSRLTYGEEAVLDVIYGEMKEDVFDLQYAKKRVDYKQRFYPMFGNGSMVAEAKNDMISIQESGFQNLIKIKKEVRRWNVIEIVREKRRKTYA